MRRICGLRPTGQLHIGHYFAVIQPALQYNADVLIADYHAPEGGDGVAETIVTLQRFGVTKIIRQKQEFQASLYFRLLALASMGELERMTQYKSTPDKDKTAHLLTYPVLMAHDVYGYEQVLVGEDQKQHVEYARNLIKRFLTNLNAQLHHSVALKTILPEPFLIGGRIMNLADPTQKMSKSQPNGCLFCTDSADVIRQKVSKAVTTPEGIEALKGLYDRLGGIALDFDPAANCKQFKEQLAELVIGRLEIKY